MVSHSSDGSLETLQMQTKSNATTSTDFSNLRILTQNCKLLIVVGEWPVMPISAAKRTTLLADRFIRNGYDIIGLNEVFLKEPTAILKREFEKNGYNVISSLPENTGSVIKINSGLMLATKLPILGYHFEHYTQYSGMDKYSMKGVLVSELETSPEKGRLFVAISHHQSEGTDDIAMSQFNHAASVIEKFVLGRIGENEDSLRRATVLYFGDMNVGEHDNPHLYQPMLEALSKNTVDLFVESNPNGGDRDGATFPVETPTDRLDYIFSLKEFAGKSGVELKGSNCKSVAVDSLILEDTDSPLSDHLGVVANIELLTPEKSKQNQYETQVPPCNAKHSSQSLEHQQSSLSASTEKSLKIVEYDGIPNEYKASKKLPYRKFESDAFMGPVRKQVESCASTSSSALGLKILELVCGEGHYSHKILQEFQPSHMTNVDLSSQMVALAKRQVNTIGAL
ncbi:UNVERIFIED_CONTAM: hypothetical protein HDU68_009338 [Siphonaria sp. JEL0065]|nr:hypothetical protein HDU68_009338 [Siphonaria sp. JEL0065]